MANTNDPMRSMRQSGPRRDPPDEGVDASARRPTEGDARGDGERGAGDGEVGRSMPDRGGSGSNDAGASGPGS